MQSRGDAVRRVDWAQSAALLVRRSAAEAIGCFDPDFFVYSDEVDFCRRLHDAGWVTLYVPDARAVHHDPPATGDVPQRRIVEALAQPRPLHAQAPLGARRLHRPRPVRLDVRRAARCCCPPDRRRYARQAMRRAAARARRGPREAAERFNRQLTSGEPPRDAEPGAALASSGDDR